MHTVFTMIDSPDNSVRPLPFAPLADLAATLGELIGDYEDRHVPRPDVSGAGMLRFLMDQHGLKQADLREIGSQGVVSEILNGKRDLNARQIKALAARFKTHPAAVR